MRALQMSSLNLGRRSCHGQTGVAARCPPAKLKAVAPRNLKYYGLFSSTTKKQKHQRCSRLSHQRHLIPIRRRLPAASSSSASTWISPDSTTIMDPLEAGLVKEDSIIETVEPSEHSTNNSVHEMYRFEEEIGRGAYGVVYSAIDLTTGEKVAIKKVAEGGVGRRSSFNKTRKEAKVMRSLHDCPSGIQFHGFYENEVDVDKAATESTFSYIVMEYCGGGDLGSIIEENWSFTEAQGGAVVCEALGLVDSCHEAKLHHGDIKVDNFALRSIGNREMLLGSPKQLGTQWLKGVDYGTCLEVDTVWSHAFFDEQEEAALTSTRQLLHFVCRREPDFGYSPWTSCSADAIDFIERLLAKDAKKQLTAREAFEHPWMKQHIDE